MRQLVHSVTQPYKRVILIGKHRDESMCRTNPSDVGVGR